MSVADLEPTIHAPKRLAIMALLAASETAEFAFLRRHLDISDSDLSKQMAALQQAGFVTARKTGRAATRSTWFSITREGRDAYGRHVDALRAILGLDGAGQRPRPPGPDDQERTAPDPGTVSPSPGAA